MDSFDLGPSLQSIIKDFVLQLKNYIEAFAFLNDEGKLHRWFDLPSGRLAPACALLASSLSLGDLSLVTDVRKFVLHDASRVVERIRRSDLAFPTYADLLIEEPWWILSPYIDHAANLLKVLVPMRDAILEWGFLLMSQDFSVESGKVDLHGTQKPDVGLLCHGTGLKRPNIPLKLMHKAFEEFSIATHTFTKGELQNFRLAAEDLAGCLVEILEEPQRANLVLAALQAIFPEESGFTWRVETKPSASGMRLAYSKAVEDAHAPSLGQSKTSHSTDVIIVEIELEDRNNGDACLKAARYFHELVGRLPEYPGAGAPTFFITLSGLNMKILGGWADPIHGTVAVDVFETLFVCQDVAYVAREQLADCLCRLKHAVSFLPQSHVLPVNPKAHQATDLPCVFETYEQFKGRALTQDKFGIRLSRRLMPEDLCHSVFLAYAENIPLRVQQPPATRAIEGNCIAKLIYGGRYGVQVHRALEPEFAPMLFGISESGVGASLLLIQFLFPPTEIGEGWLPLENLGQEIKAANLPAISDTLDNLLEALRKKGYVHGDLRPINLMVAMANLSCLKIPVQIKALDFDWAGLAGEACYPTDRSKELHYPGTAGHLIDPGDDAAMILRMKDCFSQLDCSGSSSCVNNRIVSNN